METIDQGKYKGPNLGILAIIFTLLFNIGLSFVISLTGRPPYFPGPWESAATIANYFQNQQHQVLMCGFFQFCSAIPLGLYTVTAMGKLRFLGARSAGPYIALFGGIITASSLVITGLIQWVMAYPGIAQNSSTIRALYYEVFAIGGVGYSVPLGLLIAGITVPAGFMKLLPKWMIWFGIVLACFGETSCLSLIFPKLLPLIPLTRFPGFIWLICTGFMLPKTIKEKLNT